MLNTVTITVSNSKTADTYFSRSYPHDDRNRNGKIELYETPVYELYLSGKEKGKAVKRTWKALRFMPFWNDPTSPSKKYKSTGFINAGLRKLSKRAVALYNPRYGVQNRFSPFAGAIQMRNSFLIHAGPTKLSESGWGSAGCVEVIGDFDNFKDQIAAMSGSTKANHHDAILELVGRKKLLVEVQYAKPPNFRKKFAGEAP